MDTKMVPFFLGSSGQEPYLSSTDFDMVSS